MLKIRLTQFGRKNRKSYRIVVCEARKKRETGFVDFIGTYSPISKERSVDQAKARYWLSVGAQPTDVVRSILKKEKVI